MLDSKLKFFVLNNTYRFNQKKNFKAHIPPTNFKNSIRKNAIVKYLDYQIPVTLNGDMGD